MERAAGKYGSHEATGRLKAYLKPNRSVARANAALREAGTQLKIEFYHVQAVLLNCWAGGRGWIPHSLFRDTDSYFFPTHTGAVGVWHKGGAVGTGDLLTISVLAG